MRNGEKGTTTMGIISLLTDFGIQDTYVGVMKGVMLGITPDAQFVDLTHQVPPQDVRWGAVLLSRSVRYFPAGTVHLVVVDPGVGTSRKPMAARLGEHFFVAPDNGVLTLVWQQAERAGEAVQFVQLNRPEYWLPEVSRTFHGRDIFAPVAAHLAMGVPLSELGDPLPVSLRLEFPQPERTRRGWRGEVLLVDHFGTLSTNLTADYLTAEGERAVRVRIRGKEIEGLVGSFGEAETGELVALIGSSGSLEIAVVNGSAAEYVGAGAGEKVELFLK